MCKHDSMNIQHAHCGLSGRGVITDRSGTVTQSTFSWTCRSTLLGRLVPTLPGLMLPVSWYLCSILLTQPCDTHSALLMAHGRTPSAAISTIRSRI